MAAIQVLDSNTINQIAAGEVIERPASVVKELLENAIDSKATAITVEIQGGGLSTIRVTDNGSGIVKNEIRLAFKRHATSKIRTASDLFQVASLGFRGEALASIASVAKVELITKTGDSISGSRYRIEGGEELGLEEIGAPEGTTFIARDLFYNTPVRRKFLKSPATEGSHVADLVEKIALSHPEISIRFINNNQSRLHTSGNHNLKDIIYAVFGREITSNLIEVDAGADPIKVGGFIGKPLIARGNRTYENYFINGRYIKSSIIGKAIEDAYKPFMMQHKYPFTMLQFAIDPSYIDVNVHPAKMEIRFRDGEQIYRTVYHTVAMALANRELIPAVTLEEGNHKNEEQVRENEGQVCKAEERFHENEDQVCKSEKQVYEIENGILPEPLSEKRAASRPVLKPVRIKEEHPEPFESKRLEALGAVVTDTDLVSEETPQYNATKTWQCKSSSPDEMESADTDANVNVNVDTDTGLSQDVNALKKAKQIHAVQEKTAAVDANQAFVSNEKPRQMDLFEDKLLSKPARSGHRLIGQLFDTYWMVEYHDNLYIIDQHAAHEKVLYEKTMASLEKREYTSQVINPPIILSLNSREQIKLEQYMEQFTSIGFEIEPFGGREYAVRAVPDNLFSVAKRELLLEMIDDLTEENGLSTPDLINDRVATMSCKAAVKGNHKLSFEEADKLIDELLELKNPYACPHGRPTIISMSKYELEKKFKRIV